MGGGASQDLADLYCYQCEASWMDMVHNNGEDINPDFTYIHTARYIDDAITNNDMPPPSQYGMEYTQSNPDATAAIYLGIEFTMTDTGRIRMHQYDKQRMFQFDLIWYPHV